MTCYFPIVAWRAKRLNKNGKRELVFNRSEAYTDMPLKISCGRCIGCRLAKSREWAIRCCHEASLHEDNCFVTLTYEDKSIPKGNTLVKKHFQDFMKRLRSRIEVPIKYYACGEYGDKKNRPHYHACIFNYDFKDKYLWSVNGTNKLYRSEFLEELWTFGNSLTADVTFDSAAYVARYCTKKIGGDMSHLKYADIDFETGEIINERLEEFSLMSRRPAVGKEWYDKYKNDLYNYDVAVLEGKELKPPKYYDKKFDIDEPDLMLKIKASRVKDGKKFAQHNTFERLRVREELQKLKLKQFKKRSYENET